MLMHFGNNWGYAFSSDLDNTTSFSFPSPPYTWNLNVVTHEIGHNIIGANHTHWCGWLPDPTLGFYGGGIDDCELFLEVLQHVIRLRYIQLLVQ